MKRFPVKILSQDFQWILSPKGDPLKKLLILFLAGFLVWILTSCSTTKSINHEPLTINHRDTIYLNTLQYDSIFVSHERSSEYRRGFPSPLTPHPSTLTDTIYIRNVSIEYKYKLLRDTVRLHQVDSIPIIKEVEVIRTERYIPWWSKVLNWIGAISLILIILALCVRFVKL